MEGFWFVLIMTIILFGVLVVEFIIMNSFSRLENIMRDKVQRGDAIISKDGHTYAVCDIDCNNMLITYTSTKYGMLTKKTDNWYEFAKLVSLDSLEKKYGKIGFLDKLLLKLNMNTNG